MIGSILGGIGGFFKGGALGVIGSLISGALASYNKKKEIEREVALVNAQIALAKANGDANAIIETIKATAASQVASYDHDSKTLNIAAGIEKFFDGDNKVRSGIGYFVSLVLFTIAFGLDFIRGSLRPFICYILTGLAAYITIYSIRKVGMDADVLRECAKYGLYTCMDMAGLVIGWYFGSRQQEKVKRK